MSESDDQIAMEDDLFLHDVPPPPEDTTMLEIAALKAEVSEVVQRRVGISSFSIVLISS